MNCHLKHRLPRGGDHTDRLTAGVTARVVVGSQELMTLNAACWESGWLPFTGVALWEILQSQVSMNINRKKEDMSKPACEV